MREVHNGNNNYKNYQFHQAEYQAKQAIEKLGELIGKIVEDGYKLY